LPIGRFNLFDRRHASTSSDVRFGPQPDSCTAANIAAIRSPRQREQSAMMES
jgi:hypothetical protein